MCYGQKKMSFSFQTLPNFFGRTLILLGEKNCKTDKNNTSFQENKEIQ